MFKSVNLIANKYFPLYNGLFHPITSKNGLYTMGKYMTIADYRKQFKQITIAEKIVTSIKNVSAIKDYIKQYSKHTHVRNLIRYVKGVYFTVYYFSDNSYISFGKNDKINTGIKKAS